MNEILKLKEYVESFGGTRFISVDNKDPQKVLFENVHTGKIYNESWDTDGDNFWLIVEGNELDKVNKDEVLDKSRKVLSSIKGILEADQGDKKAFKIFTDVLKDLPVSYFTSATSIVESKSVKKTKSFIKAKGSLRRFNKKIAIMQEAMENIKMQNLTLFNEDREIIPGIKKKNVLDNYEKGLRVYLKALAKDVQQYKGLCESLKKEVRNPKLYNIILESFFKNEDSKKLISHVTNYVVESKNKKVSVSKLIPRVNAIFEEFNELKTKSNIKTATNDLRTMPDQYEIPITYSRFDAPKFFRFKMGVFSPADLKIMINELQRVMTAQGSINREEMIQINEYMKTLEYMWRTGEINDQLITDMIIEFNKQFSGPYVGAFERGHDFPSQPNECGFANDTEEGDIAVTVINHEHDDTNEEV